MEKIEIGGNLFAVDFDKTKSYYNEKNLCSCDYCRLFHQNVKGEYPETAGFLSKFGIDIAKPDETGPVELDGKVLYSFAGYTVCGSILRLSDEETAVPNADPLKVAFGKGFEFPNKQEDEYFSVTVFGISLPYEL